MKETKQAIINRLAADNLALREQNSVLRTELATANASYAPAIKVADELRAEVAKLTVELAFAKGKIAEGDIRARKLIKTVNRTRSAGIPGRRAAMEAARIAAARSGHSVKVEG